MTKRKKLVAMKMKTLIKAVLPLLLLTGGMISCISEETPFRREENPSREGSIPLDIPLTRSVNDAPDKYVGSVRLIITKNNVVTNNRFIPVPSSQNDVLFKELVPMGSVDYFLIANELSSWNLDSTAYLSVGTILFANDLKKKILSFNAYPVVNTTTNLIPMVQYYEGLVVTDNGSGQAVARHNGIDVTGSLGVVDRLYAKASLRLVCRFSDLFSDGGVPIELESVSVKSMPRESYLAPDFYYKTGSADFFDGSTAGVIAGSNYTLSGTTPSDSFTGDFSFYIPEHLVADTARRTYISFVVRLIDETSIKKEYKISLGDSIDRQDLGAMPVLTYMNEYAGYRGLRVSRNTHYDIVAAVKSFSIMELEFSSKVVKWGDTGDIDLTAGNRQLEANSYVLEPGGDPVLIPVSRANAITAQLNAADDYVAEIVWMEKWDGSATVVAADMGSSSPVRAVRVAKASSTDLTKNYILVTPGTAEGNAVVAIRKASSVVPNPNPVLWSWHIWVTSGKEAVEAGAGTGNRWMDRPLGMLPNARGLYYQWGRKDAFPGGRTVTPEGATGNWGNGTKTIHDPCPPGWRVPSGAELKAAVVVNDAGFPWTTAGRQKASAGGFYPAMGWIASGTTVQSPGTAGKYWHGTSAEVLSFTNSSTGYVADTNKCAVRCIKE